MEMLYCGLNVGANTESPRMPKSVEAGHWNNHFDRFQEIDPGDCVPNLGGCLTEANGW